MALDLAGFGQILGGISSLGGLFGRGGGASAKDMLKQSQFQGRTTRYHIPNLVKGAKEAGIHPVYALGVNTPTFSPSVDASGPSFGERMADVGQNIGRAVQAYGARHDRDWETEGEKVGVFTPRA